MERCSLVCASHFDPTQGVPTAAGQIHSAGYLAGFVETMSGAQGVRRQEEKAASNPFEERWNRQTKRTQTKKAKMAKSSAPVHALGSSRRNLFQDQRVGENNPGLGEEDRYLARLQRERSRGTRKRKRYNLSDFLDDEKANEQPSSVNGDEFPSMRNQGDGKYSVLKDDFDDESLLSDSDLEGGKDASKNDDNLTDVPPAKECPVDEPSGDDEERGSGIRTHREVMNEVMGKSKMFKALRQQAKAADEEQREELDKELPEIMALLVKTNQAKKRSKAPASNEDNSEFNYEATFQKLASEPRAHATNRLKTEEEKEAEERSRLEKLEETRRARMEGLVDSESDDEPMNLEPTTNPTRKEKIGKTLKSKGKLLEASSKSQNQSCSIEDLDSVPYFFETCPSESSELAELLDIASVNLRGIIVERLVKCFAVSVDPSVNGPKLQRLLSLLLYRVHGLSRRGIGKLSLAAEEIDVLSKHIYVLASKYPSIAIEWSREQLYEMYNALQIKPKRALSKCWGVSQLLVLRLVSRIFPGSDVRHAVATPLLLLLSEALSRCKHKNDVDFAVACFICSIALELSAASTRISGQLMDFLCRGLAAYTYEEVEYSSDSDVGKAQTCATCGSEVKSVKSLGLIDCIPSSGPSCKHASLKIGLALRRLTVAALFRGRLSCIDLVYEPVVNILSGVSSESSDVLQHILDDAQTCAATRSALSLYKEKSVVAPKVLNPKFSAVNGVYRKHNRSRVRGETVEEMRESACRIRKALKKEERGYARDLRKEALLMAQHRSEIEAEKLAHADAKSRELQIFLETQQATWKQAAKKQKQMTGKRW